MVVIHEIYTVPRLIHQIYASQHIFSKSWRIINWSNSARVDLFMKRYFPHYVLPQEDRLYHAMVYIISVMGGIACFDERHDEEACERILLDFNTDEASLFGMVEDPASHHVSMLFGNERNSALSQSYYAYSQTAMSTAFCISFRIFVQRDVNVYARNLGRPPRPTMVTIAIITCVSCLVLYNIYVMGKKEEEQCEEIVDEWN